MIHLFAILESVGHGVVMAVVAVNAHVRTPFSRATSSLINMPVLHLRRTLAANASNRCQTGIGRCPRLETVKTGKSAIQGWTGNEALGGRAHRRPKPPPA